MKASSLIFTGLCLISCLPEYIWDYRGRAEEYGRTGSCLREKKNPPSGLRGAAPRLNVAKKSLRREMKVRYTRWAEHLGVFTPIKKRECEMVQVFAGEININTQSWGAVFRAASFSVSQKEGRRKGIVFLPAHQFVFIERSETGLFVTLAFMFLNHKLSCLFSFFFWALIFELPLLSTTGGAAAAAAMEARRRDLCQQKRGSEQIYFLVTVYVAYSAHWNVYIKCFSSLKITMVMVPKTKALAFCHG